MNSKEAVERLREIEKDGCGRYINARAGIRCGNKNYGCWCEDCKQEANEIGEKFKDGCGEDIRIDGIYIRACCKIRLCPNCQEIKEILEGINDN